MYSSSSASRRSIRRCIRLERPPHQIGVAKITMSAALILSTTEGQSSSSLSRKPRPTGRSRSDTRIDSTVRFLCRSFMAATTRSATSCVFDVVGLCLSEALRTSARSGTSGAGMSHSAHGLVLYMQPPVLRRRNLPWFSRKTVPQLGGCSSGIYSPGSQATAGGWDAGEPQLVRRTGFQVRLLQRLAVTVILGLTARDVGAATLRGVVRD